VVCQLPTRKRRAPNLSFNLFLRVCTLNSTVAKHELLHQPTHLHKSYYRSCITVVICNLTTLHYWPTQYTLRPAYVRTCIPLLHIHVCMYKASSKTSTVYLLLLIVIRCTMYIQVPKSQWTEAILTCTHSFGLDNITWPLTTTFITTVHILHIKYYTCIHTVSGMSVYNTDISVRMTPHKSSWSPTLLYSVSHDYGARYCAVHYST
jgi:hypothetical protein